MTDLKMTNEIETEEFTDDLVDEAMDREVARACFCIGFCRNKR
jgi:hypothetical protein